MKRRFGIMAGLTGLGGMSKAFDLERGEIGPDLFRAACRLGLEGLVSKPRDRSYQGGPSRHWVKVKNPKHPAIYRVMER